METATANYIVAGNVHPPQQPPAYPKNCIINVELKSIKASRMDPTRLKP